MFVLLCLAEVMGWEDMEENNKDIRVEKRKVVVGFSETYPDMSLHKILETFMEGIIIHDYRGFSPLQSEQEGWAIGFYISNRYLWLIYIETDPDGYITFLKVAKYSYDIISTHYFPEELKFKLEKEAEIPLDTEEARLISELFQAKLRR